MFNGVTTVSESPEQVLEKAKSWGLERVIIIGTVADGNLKWSGSFSEVEGVNFLLDAAKHELLDDFLKTGE